MGVFCDRLKFGSTVALDCRTGQNKGRYQFKTKVFMKRYVYLLDFYVEAPTLQFSMLFSPQQVKSSISIFYCFCNLLPC